MSSAARVVRVLEQVVAADSPPSRPEIVSAVGLARSTVMDILDDLCTLGYVEQVGRRYAPGPAFAGMVYRARTSEQSRLLLELRPTLEHLARVTGESTILAVHLQGAGKGLGEILNVDAVESKNAIRFVPSLGTRAVYPTASGQLFLALENVSAQDIPSALLVARTAKSRVDPVAIDAELARIRKRGYAFSADEALMGMTSLAAPVKTADGRVIAAITVVGPSTRFKRAVREIWPVLRDTLNELAAHRLDERRLAVKDEAVEQARFLELTSAAGSNG